MKYTNSTPSWAVELVLQVCKDYRRRAPSELRWYQSNKEHSNGHWNWFNSKIFIRAGTDKAEQRVVLIHELAHCIIGKSRKTRYKRFSHTIKFWRLFWELSARYGDVEESYQRDVIQFQKWYPGSRVKAQQAYDQRPKD